ncbi:MAG TPA: M20/M25/M40 family metallo-hydrolase [Candidatus Polarisedimenticolaceae bacterium]|nr:M20/M25/M40 family metallo-hydrolase [Candidatus Polarisedimenticolaceae bacterium]
MLVLRFAVALAALGLAGASAPEPPADDAVRRLMEAGLRSDGAYRKLQWLTDRIGPRLSGSENLERAVAWCADEMRRDGLDRVVTEKVMVPHWVRGDASGRILAPAAHPMFLLALGMSDGTPPDGITGEVIEASSLDEVRALGDRAKGKIVLYNKRIYPNGGDDRGYGSAVGLRYNGAVEAAKVGAIGMLIRSLATADLRLPHTGAMAYAEGVPHIPAAAIAPEDAELIHRFLVAGEPVRLTYTLTCKTLPDAESANVIGEVLGDERADEIVVIGGHLDSWDVGTGAQDDGAGCAITMEALRLIRSLGLKPKRTIRGILFTNEENGLSGGKAYAAAHAAELPRHVAAIESDSGGAKPLGFGVSAGAGSVERVRKLASPLATFAADDVQDGGGGADISPMGDAGVPQMGLRQDATRYFDVHHTMADTLDKVEAHDLALNATAMAVMAWQLANLDPPLSRYVPPKTEDTTKPPGIRRSAAR